MLEYIKIENFDREELRPYLERSEKQLLRWNEPKEGYFIAESPNVITRAIEGGYEPVSFLIKEGEEDTLNKIISDSLLTGFNEDRNLLSAVSPRDEIKLGEHVINLPVYIAKEELMKTMIGYELISGMLCLMRRRSLPQVDFLMEMSRLVILEDVVNPVNAGAIFRSAAALGMDGILLTQGCVDPLYRRAARVSMGTVFQVPWTYIPKKEDWISSLSARGYKTVAMALRNNSIDLDDERLVSEEKLAIIMGSEGDGLKAETIDRSDYVVKIPMSHNVDSLNVAAASAVAFWQLGRR